MQKLVLIALVLGFISPVTAFAAPDREGRWDVGINISGAMPDDDDVDGAVYAGGTASYGVTRWLAVGVQVGGTSFDQEDETQALGFSDLGELSAVPFMTDFIFRWNIENQKFVPYGVIGLGLIVWDFDESASVEALGYQMDIDTAFATKIGAGVDYFVNDNWIANLEGSYILSATDAELKSNGTTVATAETADTDMWMLGGGAKYLFN